MQQRSRQKVKDVVTISELADLIRELIDMVDKRFTLTENKIGALDIGLSSKISGLGNRIGDLALNRVKYDDFDALRKEVEALKARIPAGRGVR